MYIQAFRSENLYTWMAGIEGALRYFDGVPVEILIDNPKAMVIEHNRGTHDVILNETFKSFASYWGFTPRACVPVRPQTKGKVENGVGYAKRNCLAGREFESWEAMEAHIAKWLVEESDQKRLGDAGDTPQARFESEERMVLKALEGKAPFPSIREVKERVSYRELVYRLCCEEAEYEDERRIWMGLTIAHFPSVKTLDGFDWKSGVSVDQRQIEELSQCRWVADGASLFLLGSPGVGKTHLAIALGREAVKRGYTVLFTHAVSLLANLKKASQEGKLEERLTFYSKPKLLIVDELGYLPLERESGNLLFQLVSRRYERGGILLTSNRAVGEWGDIFGDNVLATAILDRLLHHSAVVTIRGESYRLMEKRRSGLLRKEQVPINALP